MGQGYYFNMRSEADARAAAKLFSQRVRANLGKRTNPLGVTETLSHRWIAGIDVCGAPDARIDAIHRKVIVEMDGR